MAPREVAKPSASVENELKVCGTTNQIANLCPYWEMTAGGSQYIQGVEQQMLGKECSWEIARDNILTLQ